MRSRASVKNFIASNARVGIGAILSILLTPLIVKYVGDVEYGTFRVFIDVFSYFSLVDIGIYSSFIVVLNQKLALNNPSSTSRTFYVAKRFYKRVFSVALIIFFITSPLIIYLVKTEELSQSNIYISYLILFFSLFNLLFKVHQGFLEANNESSYISVGGIIQNLVFSLGSLAFSYYGFGLIGLSTSFVISSLLPYLIYFLKVRKAISKVKVTKDEYKEEVKNVNKLTRANFLVHLTGKFSLYSDTLIISFILSPVSVTYYFISSRIISLAATLPGAISSSSWAAMGEIYHSGDHAKFNEYVLKISRLILVSSLLFIAPLGFISRSFVNVWIGQKYYLGEFFVSIVIFNLFVQVLMNFWGWCLSTTHHLDRAIKMQYVGLTVNLTSSVVFTFYFDEVGPVLGTLLTNIFINIPWLIYLMKDIYGISPFIILRSISQHFFIMIFLIYLYLKGQIIDVSNWVELIGSSLLLGVVFLIVVYLVGMNRTEKKFYLDLVKRLMRR